ncbi:MAG TPA: S41 family peptidase [Acidimicrobiales bacterium]|nr:S41 family peptidase [Acidimicrobiales bacterium]
MAARLAGLCRLWGVIEWFHPEVGRRDVGLQAAALDAIDAILGDPIAEDAAFRSIVEQLVACLDDPATAVAKPSAPPSGEGDADGEDNADGDAEDGGEIELVARRGDVAIVRLAPLDALPAEEQILRGEEAITDAVTSASIVLDLRDLPWTVARRSRSWAASLVGGTISTPGHRFRMHSGYESDGDQGSGGYQRAYVVSGGGTVTSEPRGTPDVVVVVDGTDADLPVFLASAMQACGALVVDVAPLAPVGLVVSVDLAGLDVEVLTSELVHADGTVGYEPDRHVGPDEDPIEVALALLSARRGSTARPTREAASPPALVPRSPAVDLDALSGAALPPTSERVLAVFHLWNVVRWHFPYHGLLDESWESALEPALRAAVAADSELEYGLVIAELAAAMQDTHASTRSPALSEARGLAGVAAAVLPIEERFVVVDVGPSAAETGLARGDVVVAVDGEEVAARGDRLGRGASGSHAAALAWRVSSWLLRGPAGKASLTVERSGVRRELAVPRDDESPERPTPVWGLLDGGVGYLDLVRLDRSDFEEAWEAVASARALVIDIRGYPRGTFFLLGPRLASAPAIAARFERPEPRAPEASHRPRLHFDQMVEPAGDAYAGEVAVLIDERAISQSEHSCLWIEAARQGRVAFVGSPTNGANGDVTGIRLPGDVTTFMTGHDVRHGDGRQLQRIGIEPDIAVRPTIEGLQAGRDEVLDAALAHLREVLSPGL